MHGLERKDNHLESASSDELLVLEERLAAIVAEHKQQKAVETIAIDGTQFIVRPNVFNPTKGHASSLLLPFLHFSHGESVLDIGCGIGTYTVLAALHGASKVIGVDRNPFAVSCTKENILSHNLSDISTVYHGSMFSPLTVEDRFDVIVTNPPFFRHPTYVAADGYIEQCFVDAEGRFLQEFLAGARKHLAPTGKIYMVYGKSGMVKTLLSLVKKYHYAYEIVATKELTPDKYYVLKLTIPPGVDNKRKEGVK